MGKRKALSKKVRFEVFKRDEFTCQYCGAVPPKVILHVDHIVPVAGGGGNSMDNLITSCQPCNSGKAARSLDAVPKSLKDRAAETTERELQIQGYSEVMQARKERLEDDTWRVCDIFIEHFSLDGMRKDWFLSIRRFVDMIGKHEVSEAVELAIMRQPTNYKQCFLYFCGTCWRKAKNEH